MPSKVTAVAPSNIALIKYWGMSDQDQVLPSNPSISMTLSRCVTRTTLATAPEAATDEVWIRRA